MKKKYLIDFVIIVLAFVVFIYWHQRNYMAIPASSLQNNQIYLITMEKTDNYWHEVNQGVADMAQLLGITYTWEAPARRDVQEQINIFNRAVEAGADAILLAASDPVEISGAVAEAKAKGVKIIYVDAPAMEQGIVTLATENYNAGIIAGNQMLSELAELGINRGSIGIIGVTPENITTINRERGFREVFERDGRFTLLDTIYTNGDPIDSQTAALRLINENNDLVGLFGTNEGSTVGVGNAILAGNENIQGIGFDINRVIQDMVRRDILNAVLVQNPYTMGYLGMAQAFAALQGYDTGPPFIDTGVSIVTQFTPRRIR